eukprot:PhM_4_TR12293/c0_g1_i1/m.2308
MEHMDDATPPRVPPPPPSSSSSTMPIFPPPPPFHPEPNSYEDPSSPIDLGPTSMQPTEGYSCADVANTTPNFLRTPSFQSVSGSTTASLVQAVPVPVSVANLVASLPLPLRCVRPMTPRRWTPDSDVDSCHLCRTFFTMFTRKHHCRICGHIFCFVCSGHTTSLVYPAQGLLEARVCIHCYCLYRQPIVQSATEIIERRRGPVLCRIPLVVLQNINQFLAIESDLVPNVSLVCRNLYFCARSNNLWRAKIVGRWGAQGLREVEPNDGVPPHAMQYYQGYVRLHENERTQSGERTQRRLDLLLIRPVKVLVMGPVGVGKSHLVDVLCPTGACYGYACGVRVRRTKLVHPTRRMHVTMDVYDTSGFAHYGAVRELCASHANALLIMYDSRSKLSMVNALAMLMETEPRAPEDVAVVLVGTNCSSPDREVTSKDVRNAHPTAVALQLAEDRDVPRVFDAVLAAIEMRIQQTPNLPAATEKAPLTALDVFMNG